MVKPLCNTSTFKPICPFVLEHLFVVFYQNNDRKKLHGHYLLNYPVNMLLPQHCKPLTYLTYTATEQSKSKLTYSIVTISGFVL